VTNDISTLFERASKEATLVRPKSDLEVFTDFLHEQGTIINASHNEVTAEGYNVIRFFRPNGGLTIVHVEVLAAIDPYASEMLSRAVVERLVIDRGFDWLEVHWAAGGLGYSFWYQVPDQTSFEFAAKEVELRIHQQRAEVSVRPNHPCRAW
jgi:hypothetical protein